MSSAPDKMKTSDSLTSSYLGSPLSVFRVIDGIDRCQPRANGPLPLPESYESESCGKKSDRLGEVKIGKLNDTEPVTGFKENFSTMSCIAPPPFGSVID